MVRRRHTIEHLSPAESFEQIRADYNAAKSSRFRRKRSGVSRSGSGADFHYRSEADFLLMMEYARDMFRNDCVVSQGIRRFVHNVVRDGFSLDPQTGDKDLDVYLAQKWQGWASDADRCEISGRFSFHDIEKFAVQQTVVDGDLFALLTDEGSIELVEAHRCRKPRTTKNVVHGILFDERRRPLQYWFTKDEIEPYRNVARVGDMDKRDARDAKGNRYVLHIFRADRVSQSRGVTALAPIFDPVGMHDDIQFAKLVQQQVVSCYAVLEEVPESAPVPPSDPGGQTGARESESVSDGTTRTVEGVSPGMRIQGQPGHKLRMDSPNVPNPEFFQQAMMTLTFIAVNLNMPVAVLLLDPTRTNFSGWRGAIDQARMSFRDWQQWLIAALHRPVYRWKIRQWLEKDRDEILLQAAARSGDRKVDLFAHRWNPPTWPYIEPNKDATAALLRERFLLTSRRRRASEDGSDWDTLSTEIVEDNAALILKAFEKARELNGKLKGLNLGWRELIFLPTPDKLSIKLPIGGDDEQAERSEQSERREQEERSNAA